MKLYALIPYVLQAIAWPIAVGIFNIRGKFTVIGKENLKNLKGTFVIASNHVGEVDPISQRAALGWFPKTPLFWVSRPRTHYTWKGWRKIVYGEWFFKSWGAYPAYKGKKDYATSLQHHIKILKDGLPVAIFPQGLKARDEGPQAPVHGGIAFLAYHTNVPIVPVLIEGTRGLNAWHLFFGKKNISLTIGEPIYVDDRLVEEQEHVYKRIARNVMDVVYDLSENS